MSVGEYLFQTLEGPRPVVRKSGAFTLRRFADHEAIAIGASRERRRLFEANSHAAN